jgi:hypothetical protein
LLPPSIPQSCLIKQHCTTSSANLTTFSTTGYYKGRIIKRIS